MGRIRERRMERMREKNVKEGKNEREL